MSKVTVEHIKSIPIGKEVSEQVVRGMIRDYVHDYSNHPKQRAAAAMYLNELNGITLPSDKCGPVLFHFYHGGA